MTSFLVRFAESGRDEQRGKTGRHLRARIAAALPGARVELAPGRLYLDAEGDAEPVLSSLHGVASYSPCVPCALDELEPRVLELAARSRGSFAVRVRRAGAHAFSSTGKAAELARAVRARWPERQVDLDAPETSIGVEIRGARAWVWDRVVPGRDRAPSGAAVERCGKLPHPRFLADQMLGRLAAWLRMLGFDTSYAFDLSDSAILHAADDEARVVLTRDRALAAAPGVFFVEPREVGAQLRRVVEAFGLRVSRRDLLSRCALCNAPLRPVGKAEIAARVPPAALAAHHSFTACDACDKVYWAGGHYQRVLAALDGLLED